MPARLDPVKVARGPHEEYAGPASEDRATAELWRYIDGRALRRLVDRRRAAGIGR